MNKKKWVVGSSIALVIIIGAVWLCSPVRFLRNTDVNKGNHNIEPASSSQLLTAAPEIILTDGFSSQMNEFRVLSSQYTWSYLDGEEAVTMSACGAHPLDIVQTKQEKLKVPKYNKIDYVPYILSSEVMPDEITVNEWDVAQLGNADEAVLFTKTYTNESLIELGTDRVYEIVAKWSEENFVTNDFYGEASYVVITQKE